MIEEDRLTEEKEEIVVITNKDFQIKAREGIRIINGDSEEGKKLIGNTSKEMLPRAYAIKHEVQICEITKKEDGFTVKCGQKTIDLNQTQGNKIKECPNCTEAIAVGWALNYVKPLEPTIADELHKQVLEDKITIDEALDRCKEIANKHNENILADTIAYLKEMAHKPLEELETEIEGKQNERRK